MLLFNHQKILEKIEKSLKNGRPFENLIEDKIDNITEMMLSVQQSSMAGIVYALEAKDAYSSRHSQRVAIMCTRFSELLELKGAMRKAVSISASIHDIGKIGIPDSVLLCPRRLTDEEFAIMKTHTTVGAEILAKTLEEQRKLVSNGIHIPSNLINMLDSIRDGVLHHHERWDGRGYPGNLQGDEIPFISRIIALCDSTDAMLSSRVYRKALSEETCKEEIRKNAGIMYDPELAEIFADNWDTIVGDLYKITDVQEPGFISEN